MSPPLKDLEIKVDLYSIHRFGKTPTVPHPNSIHEKKKYKYRVSSFTQLD